jgi:hypothetical protein
MLGEHAKWNIRFNEMIKADEFVLGNMTKEQLSAPPLNVLKQDTWHRGCTYHVHGVTARVLTPRMRRLAG